MAVMVIRFVILFRLFQLIKQTAFGIVLAVALFGFNKVCLSEIAQGTADGGLRQLQFLGDCRDRRPTFAVLVGAVIKINIHGYSPVRKVGAVEKVKTAYRCSPPQRYQATPAATVSVPNRPFFCRYLFWAVF